MPLAPKTLRIPALQVRQGPQRRLYCFSLDGKVIPNFARFVRLKRSAVGAIIGYQRPELLPHVDEIRKFLNSPNPMIPNAIVLAFDRSVRFEPTVETFSAPSHARIGTLVVPLQSSGREESKPAFVVDGQQRLAAIRDSSLPSFPVCVTAFVADDVAEQTSQFLLVNSTRPVAKGLIYELLPATNVRLPSFLERRRVPSTLLHALNSDKLSPFYRRIRTPTNPTGIIKDNSVLKMLENSLNEGALFHCRRRDAVDTKAAIRILHGFWGATANLFPSDWDAPPRRSRLTHGVGIVSMGLVMDALAVNRANPGRTFFEERLKTIRDRCRWSGGTWDLSEGRQVRWDDVENTHSDIKAIADYLRSQFAPTPRAKWKRRTA